MVSLCHLWTHLLWEMWLLFWMCNFQNMFCWFNILCEFFLRWVLQNHIEDKSTLVQQWLGVIRQCWWSSVVIYDIVRGNVLTEQEQGKLSVISKENFSIILCGWYIHCHFIQMVHGGQVSIGLEHFLLNCPQANAFKFSLMINVVRSWLGAARQQAIAWNNFDKVFLYIQENENSKIAGGVCRDSWCLHITCVLGKLTCDGFSVILSGN